MKHSEITSKIIGAFYEVYNDLGYGFLEKVYENSLCIEMRKAGLKVEQQKLIRVHYDKKIVGTYYADIVVEDKVICEIKAQKFLLSQHEAQLTNYLKATPIEVGLLFNFGEKAEFKRKIFDNDLKTGLATYNQPTNIRKNPSNPSNPCPTIE